MAATQDGPAAGLRRRAHAGTEATAEGTGAVGSQDAVAAAATTAGTPRPRPRLDPHPLLSAASLLVPLLTYLATMARDMTLVDSGELCLAAHGPGVAHPAGFPFWVLVAHLAARLPVGEVVLNINLVSVVCAAATIHLLWRLARRLAG